jgi:hypothetical protein
MTSKLQEAATAHAQADQEAAAAAKAKAAHASVLRAVKLRGLVSDIEGQMHHHLFSGLVDRLKAEERMRIGDTKGDGNIRVKLAGIEATSTSGQFGAMTNWLMAARRDLLDLEAA